MFVLLVFPSVAVAAQTVVITPKKTVYTRKINDIGDAKRTFEVRYPVISGTISPTAKKNLNNAINYWRVFKITLKDSLEEDTSLSSLDYKVNYNKNGVLDISLFSETVAAYPDTHRENLVIDLKTGKRVTFNDAFASSSKVKLAGLVNKRLGSEKASIIKSIDADQENFRDNEDKESVKQTVNDLKFEPENFQEFSISDKGVTILYDAGFPHVIRALEPKGRYFFSWAAIKPFIKPGGLLEKFNR